MIRVAHSAEARQFQRIGTALIVGGDKNAATTTGNVFRHAVTRQYVRSRFIPQLTPQRRRVIKRRRNRNQLCLLFGIEAEFQTPIFVVPIRVSDQRIKHHVTRQSRQHAIRIFAFEDGLNGGNDVAQCVIRLLKSLFAVVARYVARENFVSMYQALAPLKVDEAFAHAPRSARELRFDAEKRTQFVSVAPSFDHASSLGRELRDEARVSRLTHDGVAKYVAGGHGGIFISADDKRGANPLELARLGSARYPDHFRGALTALRLLQPSSIRTIIDQLPAARASNAAKDFAHAVVCHSLEQLLKIPT